ncbi:MAG: glutathione synthase [Deltaproteobacteria bacterium]|nr:glutathione synthase [Deltaproteobacteria bacterium]
MPKHLYVMDPLEKVDPKGDTTFDFLLEGQSRSVENWVCAIADLYSVGRHGFARARRVEVKRPENENDAHCEFFEEKDIGFDECAVVWMRKDPPTDEKFILATHIMDRHNDKKTLMMNRPSSLRVADEKLWALFADEIGPRTVVSARSDVLIAEVTRLGKAVVKPVGRAGGAGVMAFDKDDKNLKAAVDLLTEDSTRPAIVQAYLPDVRKGDKRVILIGGKPVAAVLRVPQGDDHRSNMHVGGTVEQADLNDNDRRICERLGPKLLELGLHFVGIDVIGGVLTEVNVTSPTGVQEIDVLDKREGSTRISAQLFDYIDATIEAMRGK